MAGLIDELLGEVPQEPPSSSQLPNYATVQRGDILELDDRTIEIDVRIQRTRLQRITVWRRLHPAH